MVNAFKSWKIILILDPKDSEMVDEFYGKQAYSIEDCQVVAFAWHQYWNHFPGWSVKSAIAGFQLTLAKFQKR